MFLVVRSTGWPSEDPDLQSDHRAPLPVLWQHCIGSWQPAHYWWLSTYLPRICFTTALMALKIIYWFGTSGIFKENISIIRKTLWQKYSADLKLSVWEESRKKSALHCQGLKKASLTFRILTQQQSQYNQWETDTSATYQYNYISYVGFMLIELATFTAQTIWISIVKPNTHDYFPEVYR